MNFHVGQHVYVGIRATVDSPPEWEPAIIERFAAVDFNWCWVNINAHDPENARTAWAHISELRTLEEHAKVMLAT